VLSRAATSDLYSSLPSTRNQAYVANGLNQYARVSGAGFSYDGRGNLTSDGTRAFTYDVDNKLLTGSAPTAATFTYDPLGRMQTDTASGATTTFLYDGANLAAEYNSSGTLLRRYVPTGLGMDQPLVWYEGSGTSSRRWLHADNQGSIIAYSDSSGDADAAYAYDPYGVPTAWSGSRYSYTGQLMIPEVSLYNYKARVYDPNFGRFLNADPAGLRSGMNLYAYVNGGPTNFGDPSGMLACDNCVAPVTVPPPPPDTYEDEVDLIGGVEPENITTLNSNAASITSEASAQTVCSNLRRAAAYNALALGLVSKGLDALEAAGLIATVVSAAGEPETLGADTPITVGAGAFTINTTLLNYGISVISAGLQSYAESGNRPLRDLNLQNAAGALTTFAAKLALSKLPGAGAAADLLGAAASQATEISTDKGPVCGVG